MGRGPQESLVVDHDAVFLAAAGLRGPSVIVSAGAMRALDEAELRAGLEHERAHIVRRHRLLFLLAAITYALSRPLPGGLQSVRSLGFYLERDADEISVSRTGDRLALAGAICKAALSPHGSSPFALAHLAGSGNEDFPYRHPNTSGKIRKEEV